MFFSCVPKYQLHCQKPTLVTHSLIPFTKCDIGIEQTIDIDFLGSIDIGIDIDKEAFQTIDIDIGINKRPSKTIGIGIESNFWYWPTLLTTVDCSSRAPVHVTCTTQYLGHP